MNLVIASNNKGKLKEIKEILGDSFAQVFTMSNLGITSDPEETGSTFLENARIKAYALHDVLIQKKSQILSQPLKISPLTKGCHAVTGWADGFAVLSDDSGLEVRALNNEPGVYSARYAEMCQQIKNSPLERWTRSGRGGNADSANNALLLKNLSPHSDRSAAFRCVMVLLLPDGREYSSEGTTTGTIIDTPRGTNGFGYDPLFLSDELGITMAEAEPSQKNLISHRGRALRKLLETIKKTAF